MNSKDYLLIDKVYGNYISFQENMSSVIHNYRPNSPLNILEIGCGTGISTEIILKSREEITLTSVDSDNEILLSAIKNVTSFSNLHFILSDATQFLKEQSINEFDLVVSAFTIHNMTNNYRTELFTQIYRTLKPTGLLINADKFVSDDKDQQIQGLKYRVGTYVDTLIRENRFDLLEEWIVHYINDQRPEKLLKFNQTIADLNAIGFDNTEYIFKSELEMLGILVASK